jgi:hypothetical protein
VGTASLDCGVLEGGQVYSTLCCLLVGTSHSDCITWCSCHYHECFRSVGNVFRSGSSSNVTTASVQLHMLHNSVYVSARLKLRGTNSMYIHILSLPNNPFLLLQSLPYVDTHFHYHAPLLSQFHFLIIFPSRQDFAFFFSAALILLYKEIH